MYILILSLYFLASSFILIYSLGQLHLTWYYRQKEKNHKLINIEPANFQNDLPTVTVQLPVYNELYVIDRLIDAVADFNYPKSKLEIQVLDDSTDETIKIIEKKVSTLKERGLDIQHIRRPDRKGYKAGALENGLNVARGDFLAIFDSDFIPDGNFLLNTINYFEDRRIGVVQTRWGHINKNYSLLTKLQAFGLDAHFSVEQSGRNYADKFINFNGTAGIWRRSCIINSGGWSSDTLTEDLELSYRAQLKGWKFKYLEDVVTVAELPVTLGAIKSQQFRWNKGGAETAKRNLSKVLKSNLGLSTKIHACLHLLNSTVYVFLLLAVVLSVPLLILKDNYPHLNFVLQLTSLFLISFFSISFFYWISAKRMMPNKAIRYYLSTFPLFFIMNMGMSLHNTYAVISGFIGVKSPFIRTPKFNVKSKKDVWKGNVYVKSKFNVGTISEGLLSLYFLFGMLSGLLLEDYWLIFFHLTLFLGFGLIFYYSIKEA